MPALDAIEHLERKHFMLNGGDSPMPAFSKSVSLSYDTLKLILHELDGVDERHAERFRAHFKLGEHQADLEDITCHRPGERDYITEHLSTNISASFDDQASVSMSKDTEQYLTIADKIARRAYQCGMRDDYRPGVFSEAIVSDTAIVLKQVNHWNARSIDHKKDYQLRNLEFYIPTAAVEARRRHSVDMIGNMTVLFSDMSSANNRYCGDRIYQAIQEEKARYSADLH